MFRLRTGIGDVRLGIEMRQLSTLDKQKQGKSIIFVVNHLDYQDMPVIM